jgi:hypothetical protein
MNTSLNYRSRRAMRLAAAILPAIIVLGMSHVALGAFFTRTGDIWTEQARLTPGDAALSDNFGILVAVSGDTIIVGAPMKNETRGAAYIYTRSGGIWSQQAKLTASDAGSNPFSTSEYFGIFVAVDGDTAVMGEQVKLSTRDAAGGDQYGRIVDTDGIKVVVGAFSQGESGTAYIYDSIYAISKEREIPFFERLCNFCHRNKK